MQSPLPPWQIGLRVLKPCDQNRHRSHFQWLVFRLNMQEGPNAGRFEKFIVAGQILLDARHRIARGRSNLPQGVACDIADL